MATKDHAINDAPFINATAHVVGRAGLAMTGAMCGTFVAAQFAKNNGALFDSAPFIAAMVLLGLIGFYLGIDIPRLLSLLAFHNPNATVKGLSIVPLADQPPVNVVRFAFQAMVGIGTLLALLGLVYLYLRLRRRSAPVPRWLCWAVVAAGPLSVVALISGWITTEVGRQPWIVYEVMRVDAAVTGARFIPFGYGALWLVYIGLGGAVFWLLRRFSRVPLEDDDAG